jgi:hypothetical protein
MPVRSVQDHAAYWTADDTIFARERANATSRPQHFAILINFDVNDVRVAADRAIFDVLLARTRRERPSEFGLPVGHHDGLCSRTQLSTQGS